MSSVSTSFKRLSSFYLSCVQEEGLYLLTFASKSRGKQYTAIALRRERILHEAYDSLPISTLTRRQEAFIESVLDDQGPQTGSGDRLFYGFPTHVDNESRVAPLFFVELYAEQDADGLLRLTRNEEAQIYLNHHLFRKEGYPPEEIVDIQEHIEQHPGAFREKLQVALDYLDAARETAQWDETRVLPEELTPGLYPSPILFRSTYSLYTYNLERDLAALERYEFLQEEAASSALGPYFRSDAGNHREADARPTEVLPLNGEQEAAVWSALNDPLSVITGPPGTGKSRVVVDLLAGAVLTGDPVLFASKNNKAVDVVRERLRALLGEEFDFVLRLGSRQQIEETEAEIGDRLRRLEDQRTALTDRFSEERRQHLQSAVSEVQDRIEELRRLRRECQEAVRQRKEVEDGLPSPWTRAEPPGSPEVLPLRRLRELLDRAKALAGEARLGLLLWVKRLLFGNRLLQQLRDAIDELTAPLPLDVRVHAFRAADFKRATRLIERLIDYRTWIQRLADEDEAQRALKDALQEASGYDERMEELKTELSEAYRDLLRTVWVGRIARNLPDVKRRFRGYYEAIDGVRYADRSTYRKALDRLESALSRLAHYLPVWIVTNLSVRNALPLRPKLFDLVVVDEASQCDIASAFPLLFRAERSMIIGDPMQLRHITSIKEEEEARMVRQTGASDLMPRWSYVSQSLYHLAERAFDNRGERPIFLRHHYRSHPHIIGFSNHQFYSGRLREMRDDDSFAVPAEWRGVRWFDVQGEVPVGIRSAYNDREIQGVLRLLKRWFDEGLLGREDISVGVVTPFRAQTDRLQARLRNESWWNEVRSQLRTRPPVTVGTAHRFQGDERDLMIFSPVVAPGMKGYTERWVAKTEQLLNVAITRARASLQVVGHLDRCRQAGGALGAFADYVVQHSLVREEG